MSQGMLVALEGGKGKGMDSPPARTSPADTLTLAQ